MSLHLDASKFTLTSKRALLLPPISWCLYWYCSGTCLSWALPGAPFHHAAWSSSGSCSLKMEENNYTITYKVSPHLGMPALSCWTQLPCLEHFQCWSMFNAFWKTDRTQASLYRCCRVRQKREDLWILCCLKDKEVDCKFILTSNHDKNWPL